MTNDKKIAQEVKNLKTLTSNWLDQVESIGNQNAYSDRLLEDILASSKKLEELYNSSIPDDTVKTEDVKFVTAKIKNGFKLWYQTDTEKMFQNIKDKTISLDGFKEVYSEEFYGSISLENIYCRFQSPTEFPDRSLSVGDVVVLVQEEKETYYACDTIGWSEVTIAE